MHGVEDRVDNWALSLGLASFPLENAGAVSLVSVSLVLDLDFDV